jgi:hypothetical protein
MEADLPDEADESPDGNSDRRDDQDDGGQAIRPGSPDAETRNRQDYYSDLRTAVAAEESTTVRRIKAEEQAAAEKWDKQTEESRWIWSEYQRKWPPKQDTPAKRSDDVPPGSWLGEGNRILKPEANGRVEAACDQIADRERGKISPAMRAIESQDPDRHLIGFEHRLKDRDRIKEKVCRGIRNFGRSPEQAVSRVPDAIRYTFEYQEARYTQGVWTDIGRLKEEGFTLQRLWNAWSKDQYKGINSQWIDPESDQRFEVQFHTRISFEAKQLTHPAYERLRTRQPDKFEQMVVEAFQKKVSGDVPVPSGAPDIPDYP